MRSVKETLIILLLLVVPYLAIAGELVSKPAQDPDGDCVITAEFVSVCCGIDEDAFKAIDAYLKNSPKVKNVTRRNWGMEGERTLCIEPKTEADIVPVYDGIRKLIPKAMTRPINLINHFK